MTKIKDYPYNLLLIMAFALFVASFFNQKENLNIHFYDTYIIIRTGWLFWLGVIPFLTLWVLYYFTKQLLFSKYLIWIHIFLTITSAILLVGTSFYSNSYYSGLGGMPRRYYDNSALDNFSNFYNLNKVASIAFLLLILTQLIYVLNFILGIFRKFVPTINSR